MPLERLPVDDVLPEVIDKLRSFGRLVLTAEPGAGKTTRVPPAMLDAGLAKTGDGLPAQIVVLQPRRVAARAAAARISDERGTELGAEIGYQVRHERRVSKSTRILVCTEGVFIRRLQEDPLLENVAAVIFDEFHERSLDSDLALAMVRQVRADVRPDLRIVVMSATLEAAPVMEYLGGCPAVSSPGRTHPIDVDYLQFPPRLPLEQLTASSALEMFSRSSGHLLVFLPGVGEIGQTQQILEKNPAIADADILPLYGDLPLDEQQRVLRPSKKRKIILSTNVAETSLTIEGVTAVVDSGFARVNRFDPQLGLNRLTMERISGSSANQRAGRAGRTGPGKCLRLWTERENQMLRDFDQPEIARVDLSEYVLQLLAWGESDVRSFPWFQSPPAGSLERALELLDRLDALDHGKLTELGRTMARFPLQPRLARLLIEGQRLGTVKRAALCAALLAERDPFRRREFGVKSEHHSDSDVLDRLAAIEEFDGSGRRDSLAGEILSGPAKQVLRAADQLLRMAHATTKENVQTAGGSAHDSDEAIMRALLMAFPDRVCRRREPKGHRGVMVGGRGVRLADSSAVLEGDLFLAIEFVESSNKSDSLVRQASRIERD